MSEKKMLDIVFDAIAEEIAKRLQDKFEDPTLMIDDKLEEFEGKLNEFEQEHIEHLRDKIESIENEIERIESDEELTSRVVRQEMNEFVDRMVRQISQLRQ